METTTLYAAIYNKNGSLKHSNECKAAFGRKDSNCPRCLQMINGAPARGGWQKDYFKLQAMNDMVHQQAIKDHVKTCPKCLGLDPMPCTFGES